MISCHLNNTDIFEDTLGEVKKIDRIHGIIKNLVTIYTVETYRSDSRKKKLTHTHSHTRRYFV